MSKRLLQRGRYPKAPGVDQITSPSRSPQFPQPAVMQCPTSSSVPYSTAQCETAQNVWNHPSYPNQSSYQQNQSMPLAQPNEYWSAGQMYSMPMQSSAANDSWNWKPEATENFSNYHQPQNPVNPVPETWQQVQYSDVGNQNYIQQPIIYNSAPHEYQPHFDSHSVNSNNDSKETLETSATALDTSVEQWDNSSLNVIEPENLPWTYGAPQYDQPPPVLNPAQSDNLSWGYNTTQYDNLPTVSNPDFVNSSNASWYSNTTSMYSPEMCNKPVHYLPSDNSLNGGPVGSQNVVTCEDTVKVADSFTCDNNDNGKESIDPEYGNSALSAFFQNSAENSSKNSVCDEALMPLSSHNSEQNSAHNSEYGGELAPGVKNISDSYTIEDKIAELKIHEGEKSTVVTEGEQYAEDKDDVGNRETNFIQEENSYIQEIVNHSNSGSSLGFVEEPVNQEVPEPHENRSSVSPQLHSNQVLNELPQEEPLNQQIPVESCETSRSSSSERERVVIRPREESPFKPPRINNSKGTVVQHELPIEDSKETVQKEDKTIINEVNLETVPDNLERPPDHDELRRQSLYISHQRHLRTELNSSPSSLLCGNPDIPCVTLAPAAPPIHSSARSDKSESSNDSRRELMYENPSVSKNKLKESNSSSPSVSESESKKSSKAQPLPSSETKEMSTKQMKNISHSHTEISNSEQYNSQGHSYLKESRIDDVRYQEPSRQSRENIQNSDNLISGSRHANYSQSRGDPRYPAYSEGEHSRQRFADKKYPSFDERQYYSDRERSRPSSRTSLDDRSDDFMYRRRGEPYHYAVNGDRRPVPPEYGRPPSRASESDLNRSDRNYYDNRQQQYPYPSSYGRNPDYYQRPVDYRGYEYDTYQRDPYYGSYYDAYRYAYSNYNYGFYDELYRNDPRYRQYSEEQRRQYYAQYGYEGDYERSSVHSGRSSANELSKDPSSGNRYPEPDLDSNVSEISAYNIRQDYSYEDVPQVMSLSGAERSTPSARLTPVKYSHAHPIARFSPGGLLVTSVPSQVEPTLPSAVRIQNMQSIMENQESYHDLKNYQGPLIRGLTHKNDVVEFCNQKMRNLKQKEDVVDRDSYILLWELMVLLLRQNGSVAGSDIAELLLKDHEVLRPVSAPLRQTLETPVGEQSLADVNDSSSQSHAGDISSPDEGIVVLHDKTILNPPRTVDIDKVTRRFREFLMFGHKKEALEWAMKHGLWGHALFLASKMDLRTYANVMTRFANSLALNDPLQTLYQLMSGRQPSAVTCVADKKWGDWRPHLAMILSNPSSLPDVDSRSITTLGDTLASRGCLPAAQFCYIMAQVEFGTFEQKNSKLVLLIADHRLSFEEFATNEAIQCTEIYEYAQSLANPGYLLVHLQMYKFLYALRLLDHGLLEEALHYCEVIACNLQNHPSLFTYDLISEVFKLSSSLKYHDPHFLRGQGEYEDQDDPEWLKSLYVLLQNYNNLMQNTQVQYESAEISQATSEPYSPTLDNISETPFQNISSSTVQSDIPSEPNNVNFYQMNNWNKPNSIVPQPTAVTNSHPDKPVYYSDIAQNNYKVESNIPSHEDNETTDVPSSPVTQTPPFDYYSGSTQQDMRQISYEPVNNYVSSNHRERRDSALSSSSRYSAGSSTTNKHLITSNKETTKPELKKESKPSSQAGKTWLGGIFSRLLPKAPNQMILPDDKNPTIVWDEAQQRWVNKDSNDDEGSNAPLAPPTDTELMGPKSSNKPVVPPVNSAPPDASPVNKFQRPKTRGMRQNYVDVLNNTGATTKSSVPPEAIFSSPFDQSIASNIFVPSSAQGKNQNSEVEAPDASFTSGLENEGHPQVMSTPLMFDPAEFDSSRVNVTNQRYGMGRTGRRTYPS